MLYFIVGHNFHFTSCCSAICYLATAQIRHCGSTLCFPQTVFYFFIAGRCQILVAKNPRFRQKIFFRPLSLNTVRLAGVKNNFLTLFANYLSRPKNGRLAIRWLLWIFASYCHHPASRQ